VLLPVAEWFITGVGVERSMFLRSKLYRLVATALFLAAFASLSLADTLHLKDGSIIKGKITSFTGGKFTVVMGEGAHRHELTFSSSEVESIAFDTDPTSASRTTTYTAPTRRNDPAPPPPTAVRTAPTTDNTARQQQDNASGQPDQKPRFKQWDTAQKTSTDQTRSQQTASQAPPSIRNQQQSAVIKTSATTTQPGPVVTDHPRPTPNTTTKPVAWDIKVKADNTGNGWTNTGWVLKKGQKVHITADGTVDLGKGKTSTPSGDPDIQDAQKLLKNVATGALVAVVGDDNNDFLYIGAEREFTASRDGALFLGLNEGYLDDNKGAYAVKVEILPD